MFQDAIARFKLDLSEWIVNYARVPLEHQEALRERIGTSPADWDLRSLIGLLREHGSSVVFTPDQLRKLEEILNDPVNNSVFRVPLWQETGASCAAGAASGASSGGSDSKTEGFDGGDGAFSEVFTPTPSDAPALETVLEWLQDSGLSSGFADFKPGTGIEVLQVVALIKEQAFQKVKADFDVWFNGRSSNLQRQRGSDSTLGFPEIIRSRGGCFEGDPLWDWKVVADPDELSAAGAVAGESGGWTPQGAFVLAPRSELEIIRGHLKTFFLEEEWVLEAFGTYHDANPGITAQEMLVLLETLGIDSSRLSEVRKLLGTEESKSAAP